MNNHHMTTENYKKDSLTLGGAVSMGTGVMIGAGVFALTGQVAELAREWFPLAFLVAGVIAGFSAYSYIKMSNAYPSAGGIAMFLKKAYGTGIMTASFALLMSISMIINESLVARTFGTYTLQLFDAGKESWLISFLAAGLLLFALIINAVNNKYIQSLSFFMAFAKVLGLALLALGGLWASGLQLQVAPVTSESASVTGFMGAVALGILAYKGFTTITNSGDEIQQPHKNVGRAIIISLAICAVVYLLISLAVSSSLSIDEIIASKDYALAEAARPAYGEYGLWITVSLAIVATVSGVIASVFAVSRMLAMLTEMKLVPHHHFGMPGGVQKHTVVYTVALAILLAIFFDLSRIASLGAIFYIIMDLAIHWGIFKYLRKEVHANSIILVTAMFLDLIILLAFLWIKIQSDVLVIWAALAGLLIIFGGEYWFLQGKLTRTQEDE